MKKICLILFAIILVMIYCTALTSCNEEEYEMEILNEWDKRKIERAIIALDNSPVDGIELAKWIYTVAFTASIGLEGESSEVLSLIFDDAVIEDAEESLEHTEEVARAKVNVVDMVVPSLYYSHDISDASAKMLRGKSKKLKADNFITGDLLVTQDNVYIFNGETLVLLKAGGIVYEDIDEILKSLKKCERWAVLRPSNVIKFNHSTEWSTEGYTEKQKAIVTTAESFLMRGMRVQYDDSRLSPESEFRWHLNEKSPEDYTAQEWGYTNCAAFAIDVHRLALGYETSAISGSGIMADEEIRPFYYEPTGEETEEERARIKEEFFSTLEPGDIIIFIRADKTGHVILYIGCGDVIHSTGGSYRYADAYETYEPTVRYRRVEDIFTPEVYPTSFVFENISKIAIVRPAMNEALTVTDSARARMDNMQGILAEKLSSHNKGISANIGDEITYTIRIYNTSEVEKTLAVSCTLPENTTLVRGGIPKTITVTPSEKVEVTYTVTADSGKTVSGAGTTVGGLEVKCPDVQIKTTLTSYEQKALGQAIDEYECAGEPIEGANEIYKSALGQDAVSVGDFKALRRALFTTDDKGRYKIRKAGGDSKAVVPSFWGGRNCYTETFAYQRTALVKPEHVLVGDLILIDNASEEELYICAQDYILNLATGEKHKDVKMFLERLVACKNYFALLRPSMKWS